jgi:hypothetical protein
MQMSAFIRLWQELFRDAGRQPWSAELPIRSVLHLHSTPGYGILAPGQAGQ